MVFATILLREYLNSRPTRWYLGFVNDFGKPDIGKLDDQRLVHNLESEGWERCERRWSSTSRLDSPPSTKGLGKELGKGRPFCFSFKKDNGLCHNSFRTIYIVRPQPVGTWALTRGREKPDIGKLDDQRLVHNLEISD